MKKKIYIRLLLGLCFIGFILFLRTLPIREYATLTFLKSQLLKLQSVVSIHYLPSVLLYISVCFLVVVLSLPLVAAMTVTGGALFGTIHGTLFVNIGATLGAIVSFYIYKYFLGDVIEYMYPAQLTSFNRAMEKYGALFLLVIHFVTVIPFFLINALAGICNAPLFTFIWTTSLGIIPASFVFAFAGSQLSTINSIKDVLSLNVILAFILLIILAMLPTVYVYFTKTSLGKKV